MGIKMNGNPGGCSTTPEKAKSVTWHSSGAILQSETTSKMGKNYTCSLPKARVKYSMKANLNSEITIIGTERTPTETHDA